MVSSKNESVSVNELTNAVLHTSESPNISLYVSCHSSSVVNLTGAVMVEVGSLSMHESEQVVKVSKEARVRTGNSRSSNLHHYAQKLRRGESKLDCRACFHH